MAQKILIVTDAWGDNQVNGVVTTLKNLVLELERLGHEVRTLSPEDCKIRVPMPWYDGIDLGFVRTRQIREATNWADAIHISTPEGPVGMRSVRYCERHKIPFTTSYHTKWPEFVRARFPIPESVTRQHMRNLHKKSRAILVPTDTVCAELKTQHFRNIRVWTRGVDRELFNPDHRCKLHVGRPLLLCVSRVSQEKNIEAFCEIDWPGRHTKMVVGDGPHLAELKKRYGDSVIFTGMLRGHELAHAYACADVFVFPSKADTFGVVMLEAMACGTPVAAYPVTGPLDVIEHGATGYMDADLKVAVEKALTLDRGRILEYSEHWSWRECAEQFLDSLVPFN